MDATPLKRVISLLAFMMAAIVAAAAGDTLLEQANQHYKAQEFQKAVETYSQIVAGGYESGEVYFNLGNACFKTGDYVNAILNYERALLLDPRNEDIRFNLRIANQYVVDNLEQLPRPFFARWWEKLAESKPADGWAAWSVISFFVFLVLLGAYFFGRTLGLKKVAFYCSILAFLVMATGFLLAHRQHNVLKQRNSALLVCPRTAVKSAPSATGTDLFLIHEGLKVSITDSLNQWKEIRLSDGNKGWVRDSCLVRI